MCFCVFCVFFSVENVFCFFVRVKEAAEKTAAVGRGQWREIGGRKRGVGVAQADITLHEVDHIVAKRLRQGDVHYALPHSLEGLQLQG